MMKTIILLSAFLCVSTALAVETNSVVVKLGDKIGDDLKTLEKYPRTDQARKMPFGPSGNITARWNVGSGTLLVTHSAGIGIITGMRFIASSDGENEVAFEVKQFNPLTGELTIIIPNKPFEHIGAKASESAK